MDDKKKLLSLLANVEEVERFELIKKVYQRKSDSDTIRVLINQAAEKILVQNTAMVAKGKGEGK